MNWLVKAEPTHDGFDALVKLDLVPVERLPRPVTLAEIKADPAFKDFLATRPHS
jgi:predicted RNA-binding protein with PUA-like domain